MVRLTVGESFNGAVDRSIEVATASSSSACGVEFREGGTYLVFAHVDPSRQKGPLLSTTKCGHTSAIDEAGDALRYLRARAAAREPGGIIHGVVRTRRRTSAHEYTGLQEKVGLRMRAEGPARAVETLTDSRGRFVFEALGPGRYRVTADAPGIDPAAVDLSAEGCASTRFHSSDLATVKGRYVARDEEQAQQTFHLLHDGWHRQSELFDTTSSKPDGSFVFDDVAPGEYVLALNPLGPHLSTRRPEFPTTFYPGVSDFAAATRLTVAAGQVLDVGELMAPPLLSQVRVEGQVLGQEGAPVAKATVDASHEGSTSEFVTTDENGHFALSVPEGTHARLRVFAPEDGPRVYVPFHAVPGLAPLRIVLSSRREEPASEDSIEIVRIDPPDGARLRPGDDVLIRVTVRCQLATTYVASVSLVIQDDAGSQLALPQPTSDAARGSAELTLESRVRIPEKSSTVRVFTPLRLPISREMSIVDSAQYTIVREPGNPWLPPPLPYTDYQ